MMNLKLNPQNGTNNFPNPETSSSSKTMSEVVEPEVHLVQLQKSVVVDLGHGSEVLYRTRFLSYEESWNYFEYLNKHIPWIRPTILVFGRPVLQPRDSCYIASEGLAELGYSGYKPHAHSWDEFPPLKKLLDEVHRALPGSRFNSLVLNRYKGGNDYVSWHTDKEKSYGPTPEIASVTFGCEREFLLKKRPKKTSQGLSAPSAKRLDGEPPSKKVKKSKDPDQHTFMLKHGSLLVMRGYTQRDWLHSVPKRVKAGSTRINLTFRLVL
ncbi:oxygenase [Lithospermum erythrorhizon]|uniref:Oxygenase n=1 Tax=Lithospermum erythrorhizon TaxID=34254 RepID=A0AAV3P8K2_LITER